jgi:hypothetical protein
MLDHAVNLDLIELNSASTIKSSTIGADSSPPRQHWLCREEVASFWQGLSEGGVHPAQSNCLRLILSSIPIGDYFTAFSLPKVEKI